MFKLILAGILFSQGAWAATPEENAKVVQDFYNMAFNQHKPEEAMAKYVGNKYIQHNPFVADGKEPFNQFFVGFFKKNPHVRATIKRTIAQNDLVVLHVHSQVDKADRGRAVIDIFRLEGGKIVEHWDVAQPIPDKIPHSNTMF